MRIKTLMIAVSLTLFFPATAQISRAQKDGEAQVVSFDENSWPTLKFSNKDDKPDCGLFISYSLTADQEESFVIRVAHLHHRALWGKFKFPEEGWLYITPSRIIFTVEKGDKSHAFDVPRTDLEDKPATRFRMYFVGIQINLRERLPASDSREQKFVSFIIKDRKCTVDNQKPYSKFLERTVSDFNGAMAEFKQLTASLKQAGKIQQAPAFVLPPMLPANPTLRKKLSVTWKLSPAPARCRTLPFQNLRRSQFVFPELSHSQIDTSSRSSSGLL